MVKLLNVVKNIKATKTGIVAFEERYNRFDGSFTGLSLKVFDSVETMNIHNNNMKRFFFKVLSYEDIKDIDVNNRAVVADILHENILKRIDKKCISNPKYRFGIYEKGKLIANV